MEGKKQLLDLYNNITFTTLKAIIYDMMNQLDEVEEKNIPALKARLSLPVSIYVKYSAVTRNDIVQFCIDNDIEIDCSYSNLN
jgi:predicted nucleotide-binding protein (sugar kinase/HSP70/actin superfamily)